MITYDDFIEDARRATISDSYAYAWVFDDINDNSVTEHDGFVDAFVVSWVSGGKVGGNCWSSGGHSIITPEDEPEMERLVDLLEKLDLSFRDARKILSLVKSGESTDHGYYGNFTRHSYKYISFNAIYDELVDLGLAESRSPAARS